MVYLRCVANNYQPGTSVEVLVRDFTAAGFPQVWRPAIVESVTPLERGLSDVTLRMADGTPHIERVGKRGNNPLLRVVLA